MLYQRRKGSVWASEIAEYLNTDLVGEDFLVESASTFDRPVPGSVLHTKKSVGTDGPDLPGGGNLLVLLPDAPTRDVAFSYVVTDAPEFDFVQILNEFFVSDIEPGIDPTAVVHETAILGREIHVGPHSVIGPDVKIGAKTVIMSNVVISGLATIGSGVVIKDNAVVGSQGYSFVFDRQGRQTHVPHLGEMIVGDGAWIGACATIERAAFADTVIGQDVKLDDLVHIGAGCRIGAGAMITSGTVLGRAAKVGENTWIAPNVTIKENVTVGSDCLVGMGSTVLTDLDDSGVYVGTPAKFLKKNERKSNEQG